MAVGGNQMKFFSMQDKNEIMELQANPDEAFYTCDSSTLNLKFLAGGKKGNMFYLQSKTD